MVPSSPICLVLCLQGDPGVESVYNWTAAGQTISMRGASGKGDGKHTLTGPVYVCGAEPGDVIQVGTLPTAPTRGGLCYELPF